MQVINKNNFSFNQIYLPKLPPFLCSKTKGHLLVRIHVGIILTNTSVHEHIGLVANFVLL